MRAAVCHALVALRLTGYGPLPVRRRVMLPHLQVSYFAKPTLEDRSAQVSKRHHQLPTPRRATADHDKSKMLSLQGSLVSRSQLLPQYPVFRYLHHNILL